MSTNTNFAQNRIAREPYWVEYLENPYSNSSTNRATVDTGIAIGDIGAVRCTIGHPYPLSTGANLGFGVDNFFFFGGRTNSNQAFIVSPYLNSSTLYVISYGSSVTNKVYSLYAVSKQDGDSVTNSLYYTKGNGLIDSSTLMTTVTRTVSSLNLNNTFPLFICKNNSGTITSGLNCRIYSCHIFDHDGNLISWLRPCLHPDTLTPAFYDLVRHRYLYVTGANAQVNYGHNFIPVHYIRLNDTTIPAFNIWGVDSNHTATLSPISPNPYTSRLDMAVRYKGGSNNIIKYPSTGTDSMVISGSVQSDNDSVFINLIQDNGGSTAMEGIGYNSIGKVSNIIVRNDIDNGVCYFTSNGVTHTQLSSYLVDRPEGDYPTIGSNPCVMDIESFSMRYTTPATSVQGVKPFGIYYDFQPCRIITEGENYGKSAFFDYVNAQYIISTNENNMSASEGFCTLTVQDALSVPTAQATAWQYNMP